MELDQDIAQLIWEFPSNTAAGTCNNSMLFSDTEREITGRIFYKVREHGTYSYRFFFCNAVDTTFDNGNQSYANLLGDAYEVITAFAGDGGTHPGMYDGATLQQLTFAGESGCTAQPGDLFAADPCTLTIPEDHYLVFQWTVRGKNIPYTPDKIIPAYTLFHDQWRVSNDFPQPILVGAQRDVSLRLAFLGDSITQGLGTRTDLYEHWVAKITEGLPHSIAIWNIGLGFARAQDAGSDGHWLAKAKTADFVNLCLGVNDLGYEHTAAQIQDDLTRTVKALKAAGVRVGIFTIPPFDYNPAAAIHWRNACRFIREELAPLCAYCLEPATDWGLHPPYDHISRWGGHPDGDGCALLAQRYLETIKL